MAKKVEAQGSPEFIYGIFKKEIKNRFLCRVEIAGEVMECYLPSSCRLGRFLNLTNAVVMLRPTTSRNARTSYSVYAVQQNGRFLLLNLARCNRLIEENIGRPCFAFLGDRQHLNRERLVEGYRSDLFIEDTRTIVEVKSLLSFEEEAEFPSVYSERAIRQLRKIFELLGKGYGACYIFVALNPAVERLKINSRFPAYATLFKECTERGMRCVGFSTELMESGEPRLKARLLVEL